MKKLMTIVALFSSIVGCTSIEQTAYTQEEMINKSWYVTYICKETGITLNTRVFVPRPYPSTKCNVAMFLHCAGHEGDDNVSHLCESDIGKMVYHSDNNSKFIILAPQCPVGKSWTDEDMIKTLDLYVDFIGSKVYISDVSHVYLTGFSMGGIGTFKLAMYNPKRYTVLMPVCGGPKQNVEVERPEIPNEMKNAKIWSFNNVNDFVVDNMYSKYVISQMWKVENKSAHYTEQNNGHTDEYVYSDKDVLNWFFSQNADSNNK